MNGAHPGVTTCECGADGQGCAATSVPWSKFWVTGFPTIPISFVEWPAASQCAARRIPMPSAG